VPALTIDAEVDLHLADAEYSLSTQFDISLPDLDRGVPQSLVEEAERLCPYSKATQGNVDVLFNLI
jgi:organic hydroperoxide reductase OsmC/OhrA